MPAEVVVSPAFEEFAEVARRALLAANGGAVCVYHRGAVVVDLWAGERDPAADLPWYGDTMSMAWSTTKGIASVAVHQLAERGLLDIDAPVAAYWPEYARAGKDSTTVRHVLAMEAGMFDVRHLIDDPWLMLDHEEMAARLAAAAPAHPPGSAHGYHALTYGWLVGELVRRVTGDSLGAYVQREIARPLGLDGCYIGVPDDEIARVAARPRMRAVPRVARRAGKIVDPALRPLGFSPARMAAAFVPVDGHEVFPADEFLRAEVPAANGVFTARSLARIYAALGSDDGLDGVRLWSPATRRRATEPQSSGRDLVLALPVRWRLGFHRPLPTSGAPPSAFGFYGAYGSGAFADPEHDLAVAFVVQAARGMPMTRIAPAAVAAAAAA